MIITLTESQAGEVAAVAKAAHWDHSRSALMGMRCVWKLADDKASVDVEFQATNSYIFVVRTIRMTGGFDVEGAVKGETIIGSAAEFAKALNETRKAIGNQVVVVLDDDKVTVSNRSGSTLRQLEVEQAASFPNIEKVLPDQLLKALEDARHLTVKTGAGYDYSGPLPVLGHKWFRVILDTVGASTARKADPIPLRLIAPAKHKNGEDWKPWGLVTSLPSESTSWFGVIMPTRI